MASKYIPAVPGVSESTSPKVREQVEIAQRRLDSVQRKIKRDLETARGSNRSSSR
jgi:hypothetical protein